MEDELIGAQGVCDVKGWGLNVYSGEREREHIVLLVPLISHLNTALFASEVLLWDRIGMFSDSTQCLIWV